MREDGDGYTDPEISFDEHGICNHYYEYKELSNKLLPPEEAKKELDRIVKAMKEKGKGKAYDCIIGLSGGVDSSYCAYLLKELGLRPLVVHFDNGWNSELAVKNIENIVKKLGFDLQTYVIDWEEFKDVQMSFLKASVHNCEIPTDHAISASMYKLAAENNISYIISGSNIVTEGILPKSWGYDAMDLQHLRGIHRRFGNVKLKTFPQLSMAKRMYYTYANGIKLVRLLNLIPYNKQDAMDVLQNKLDWVYYGGKHYESVFTRFFQAYILPEKFNVDKRKAHLSTLICSGQMSREDALKALEEPVYPQDKLQEDKEYVLKKFGLSEKEFEEIMQLPPKSYKDYPNSEKSRKLVYRVYNKLRGRG